MPEPISRSSQNPYAPIAVNTCSEASPSAGLNQSAMFIDDADITAMDWSAYDFARDGTRAELTSQYTSDLQSFLSTQAPPAAADRAANSGPNASVPQVNGIPTSELPNISAGTPRVGHRPLANAVDLVKVDQTGKPAGSPGAGTPTETLTPDAALAFRRLREYAARDGIDVQHRLLAYSTFRSDAHQEALNVADPEAAQQGFRAKSGTSTHRTGNALDVTVSAGTYEYNNSSKERDQLHRDAASQWLEANAEKFGFTVLGVIKQADGSVTHATYWEPWHITYNPTPGASLPPSLESGKTP